MAEVSFLILSLLSQSNSGSWAIGQSRKLLILSGNSIPLRLLYYMEIVVISLFFIYFLTFFSYCQLVPS